MYLAQRVQAVLKMDGKHDLRPMSHYEEEPTKVAELFDIIGYNKGVFTSHTLNFGMIMNCFFPFLTGPIKRYLINYLFVLAGSVLHMFMHAFTEKSFRKGLKYYLTDQ